MAMNTETLSLIKQSIKTIPNYPKEGILFRDVTSLLENAAAYKATIDLLVEHYRGQGFTKIVGTEARGFLFGAPLALELGVGFVPVRKPGKLPRATISQSYELEYGHDSLEIHPDAINPNDKVLVVDDVLRRVHRANGGLELHECGRPPPRTARSIASGPRFGRRSRRPAAT